MKKAIYPGSFDPITNGHIDIVHRALGAFNKLTIAVLENRNKSPLFTTKERKAMLAEVFKAEQERIEILSFSGLLVDFAEQENASVIVRGLRAASDFEYEFQLAAMNRHLNKKVDTIFFMTGSETYFLSSALVKEVASLGGNIEKMVPKTIALALKEKFSQS